MITEAIQEALNKQLNAEFYTTYNYLAISAKFRLMGLHGFARWARVQAKIERGPRDEVLRFHQRAGRHGVAEAGGGAGRAMGNAAGGV